MFLIFSGVSWLGCRDSNSAMQIQSPKNPLLQFCESRFGAQTVKCGIYSQSDNPADVIVNSFF